jgi:hypothetical protein
MASSVDDAMIDTLAPCAVHADVGDVLRAWYGGLAHRLCLPLPDDPADDDAMSELVAGLRR